LKGIIKDLDKGFYHEARREKKHALAYLTEKVNPEPPEVERIEKRLIGRYSHGRDLSGTCLEKNLSEYAWMVCGLEKEMAARGISRHDTVEKAFFSSTNASSSQGLFPAFLASQIIAGQLAASLVPELCLTEVRINSHLQEKVAISDTAATRQLRHIGEGVDLPKVSISKTSGSVALQKYGRLLEASYESVRLLHLDIIGLQMQRIGRQMGIDETDDLIETLVSGDGNSNSAATNTNVATASTLTYTDLISLFQAFGIGYTMRKCVVNDTHLRSMLNMAELKDPLAFGNSFQATGDLPNALGAMWHRWTSTGSAGFGTTKILAIDERVAVVCLREGDLLEESDNLIDKQIHRRSMSEWVGFMGWDAAGAQTLTV
jgi:hypothetical protein